MEEYVACSIQSLRMSELRMKLACSLAEPGRVTLNNHAGFILTSDILSFLYLTRIPFFYFIESA